MKLCCILDCCMSQLALSFFAILVYIRMIVYLSTHLVLCDPLSQHLKE